MATAADISVFLTQVKASLSSNNYKILDQRWKYRSTLSQLGIVDQDVIDDIGICLVMRTGFKNRMIILLFLAMFGCAKSSCTECASILSLRFNRHQAVYC